MTYKSEAQYWAHLITHHPDAVVPIRDVLNVIKAKYMLSEGDGVQEVRYGFQDGSGIALRYELHGVNWNFVYVEEVDD